MRPGQRASISTLKSTVFNALTGMNQHTGNWPGKTVANAQGYCYTTLLTIKKETGSLKWTALAAALPTVTGMIICILFIFIARLFG